MEFEYDILLLLQILFFFWSRGGKKTSMLKKFCFGSTSIKLTGISVCIIQYDKVSSHKHKQNSYLFLDCVRPHNKSIKIVYLNWVAKIKKNNWFSFPPKQKMWVTSIYLLYIAFSHFIFVLLLCSCSDHSYFILKHFHFQISSCVILVNFFATIMWLVSPRAGCVMGTLTALMIQTSL